MKVIVGLGNPGTKYDGTRHNIGFVVLGMLGRKFQAGPVSRGHEAEMAELLIGSEKVLLFAPQTYMNLSGRAVGSLARFYKLMPEDLLVVCDDLNLPCGQLRMRAGGSSGGQKGLQDIIRHLGTEQIARLRFGIGRPPGSMDASTYVLKPFLPAERETVEHACHQAVEAAEMWVREGATAAMNQVNARPQKPQKQPPRSDHPNQADPLREMGPERD